MILIAESGSTKTQWSIVDSKQIIPLVNTPGINPLILSINEIETVVRPVSSEVDEYSLEEIYFFGAGCATPSTIHRIQVALSNIFECNRIVIDTDLKAACLALAGDQPGMIGLLGTGSNSCIWDGQKVTAQVPSLGYVLGDEGGGASIGKQLVADYLKKQMPETINRYFAEKYKLSTAYVLERVYQTPMANRYLAGFAPFIEEHYDDTYCQSIINQQFTAYFERNIMQYPNFDQYGLYFCGSIAYIHRDLLLEIGGKYGLSIKKIVKAPINDLAIYFQKAFLS